MDRFNWEFYACLRGKLRPTFEGEQPEEAGATPRLWLFPPQHRHGWQSAKTVERAVFHFSSVPDVIRDACRERGQLSMPLEKEDVEMIRALCRSLKPHYRAPTPTAMLLFERALIDLSLLFLRGRNFGVALPLETLAVERVERVSEWYLAHLHERPTLEALADVAHVSVAHLRRHFQLVHGRSPHAVFTQLRVERAAELLGTTNDTLEAIARRSGFNSASDLCRVFKRRMKVYPNEWRTQVANKEAPADQVWRHKARVESGAPRG